MTFNVIKPDWPAPANVHAFSTTRKGGVSKPPYDSLNLAEHVGDVPASVIQNRKHLRTNLGLPSEPVWLRQVHGIDVIDAAQVASLDADGSLTNRSGVVCAVMTADCLPVLICNRSGTKVAAVHAGWRGLEAGILEQAILQLGQDEWMAWLGPAIGPDAFEVGDEVRMKFLAHDSAAEQGFKAGRPGHWWMDIYLLARQRLNSVGVAEIYGGEFCTYHDADRFYSYRRDGDTGRMVSLIWLS